MHCRAGILFVHGIVGNNRIFDFLLPSVPEKYDVKYIVLDGHGGDALDFSRTSMKVWRQQVEDAGTTESIGCILMNTVLERVLS